MYIAASIAVISLVEIIVMVLFRSWEIKKGSMSHHLGGNKFDVFHLIHRTGHSVIDKGIGHGKSILPRVHGKLRSVVKSVHSKVGTGKIHDIVKGRNNVDNGENSTSSLFLKDITEHKNGVRKRIENGKEKIRVD